MSSSRTNFTDPKYREKRGDMCLGCNMASCKNSGYPGLLRLDSTGEISSARPGHPTSSRMTKNQPYCSNANFLNQNSTVMDSFNAYLGSAAAYLGKSFAKSLSQPSPKGVPSDCIPGFLMSGSSASKTMHSAQPEDSLNFKTLQSMSLASESDKPMHWTESFLGVLQSSIINNCSSNKNMMGRQPFVEKYVPPQRRCGGTLTAHHNSSSVDPKLTPYNARLLQKSKQTHSEGHKTMNDACPLKGSIKISMCPPKKLEPTVIRKCENSPNITKSPDLEHSQTPEVNERLLSNSLNNSASDGHTADVINNNESNTPDWFEYETISDESAPNSDENCESVPLNGGDINSFPQVADNSIKELRNWFSVENDNEVKSDNRGLNSDESSQTSGMGQSICDSDESIESVDNDNSHTSNVTGNSAESKLQDIAPQVSACSVIAQETVMPSTAEQKDINAKVVTDNSDKKALLASLYIRNCGKRNRPSAKKRRRHKAQQLGESSDKKVNKKPESKTSSKPTSSSSACQPSSIVAFILGNDSDDDNDSHTVRFQCNFDSDSDWSDSDCETDENLSSLDDEDLLASELGFRCTDPLMFQVSCSVQSAMPVSQSHEDDPNSIDKINTMWRVQVCVEPEVRRKSKSTKQVHFAESKSLATVHPMITWCHAYQAARKGPWEQYARDRARFMRRVTESEDILKPILHQKHRDRVYSERYAENSSSSC